MEHAAQSTKEVGRSPSRGAAARAGPAELPPLHPLLQLQRNIGNQAVLSLLRSGAIQAKLAVGSVDDPEEKQADEIADTVMRKPSGAATAGCTCAAGGEMCEECRKKEADPIGGPPMVRRRATTTAAQPDAPPIVRQTLGGSGSPLDSSTRTDMESRFGRDFGDVRVHTDDKAAQSARAIDAHAYTFGNDIVFGEGQFAPQSQASRALLAHELTHVVQQGAAPTHSATVRRQAAPATAPQANPAPGAQSLPIDSTDDFQQQVFSRATARLDSNRAQLDKWRQFINSQFDDIELKAQIAAVTTESVIGNAQRLDREQYLEPYFSSRSPADRAVYEGILNGRINSGCEQCHESNIAWQWNVSHPEFRQGPTTAEELAGLANYARLMGGPTAATPDRLPAAAAPSTSAPSQTNPDAGPATIDAPPARLTYPARRSDLCGELPSTAVTPAPFNPAMWGPSTTLAVAAVQQIQPVLEPLGPAGYRVLPEEIFSTLYNRSPKELRALVMDNITERQSKYMHLVSLIAAGHVDYKELCPIVDELLPLASEDVQSSVRTDIAINKAIDVILDIILAIATAALVLLSIVFPPAAILTASLIVGALQVGVGLGKFKQGYLYSQGIGAGVFSPEQEAQAGSLMVGGGLQAAFGAVMVGQSAAGLARLPPTPGAGGVAASGRFQPLADGSYVAFHPQDPNVVMILEGDKLTAGVWVEGEFRPLATAQSPWAGNPPPGTPTWAEWTAARGWPQGGWAPPGGPGGAAAPQSFGLLGPGPQPYGLLGAGPEPYGLLGPGPQPYGLLGAGPEPSGLLGPGPQPYGLLGAGPEPYGLLGPGPQPYGLLGPGPQPYGLLGAGSEPYGLLGPGPEPYGLLGAGPEPYGLLGPGNPTTYTWEQISRMRQPQLWQERQTYMQQVYGVAGEQHFPVPGTGGRYVDVPAPELAGEVKSYTRWITVEGQAQRNIVRLTDRIQEQIDRDVWLRANRPGYDPRWIFTDAPPEPALREALYNANITFIVFQ